jgi:hypothetical protein
MTTQDTSGYQVLLSRARRNFALCVMMMQGMPLGAPATPHWRKKADKLQFAINAASGLASGGDLAQACEILARENAAR